MSALTPLRCLFVILFLIVSTVPVVWAQTPADTSATVRTEVYAVTPTRGGDAELKVDLYLPEGRPSKGAVVLVHGGSFITGARDIQENKDYGRALAARGYVAAAISYRLLGDEPVVDGWGRTYARSVAASSDPLVRSIIARYGEVFTDAVAASAVDVVSAVRWLRGHADALGFDPADVALFGASAGAISALTVAYTMDAYGGDPPEIAAVIDLRGLMLRPRGGPLSIEHDAPPLLMFHGEADERVAPAYADTLFDAAREAGVGVGYFSAPGFGHELGGDALLSLRISARETVLDRIDAFLSSSFEGRTNDGHSSRGHLMPTAETPGEGTIEPKDDARVRDDGFRGEIEAAVDTLVAAVDADPGFVESLYGVSRRDLLLHPFDDAAREAWSYWPRKRAGLPLRYMTGAQREMTQDVLATVLSAKGYLQANHVMLLEEVLAAMETTGFSRGVEEYTMAVFGRPSRDVPWAFRFEGHHLSLNVTLTPEAVTVTPSFVGASPARLRAGARAGFGPLRHEQHLAFALLHALDDDQRAAAVLSDEPPDEILSSTFQKQRPEWDQWKELMARDGVSSSTFDTRQLTLLRRLLDDVVGTYRDEISEPYVEGVDLNTLSFAWMGATQEGKPHYFRIQGEHFVFELDAAQEGGNHVHTVWRDRDDDFGAGTLESHYQTHAH